MYACVCVTVCMYVCCIPYLVKRRHVAGAGRGLGARLGENRARTVQVIPRQGRRRAHGFLRGPRVGDAGRLRPHRRRVQTLNIRVRHGQGTYCTYTGSRLQRVRLHRADFYRPKRSFGQGNIFTGVCLSTGGGCLLQIFGGSPNFRGGVFFWGGYFLGGFLQIFLGGSSKFSGGGSPPEYSQRSASSHPTGMHSCSL